MPIQHIPTTIFMGFLGSGKTTAILNLFKQKPENEYWAVLVNEFGKIGIDGKIYAANDIAIEEISGGCMCCTQGVPMRVSINRLLQRTHPDRLLIESSGVGHPSGLLKILQSPDFENILDIKATIALLDPEKLLDPRIQANLLFQDQLQCADILLANKVDIASDEAMLAFEQLANEQIQASLITQTQYSTINIDWLDFPHQQRESSGNQVIKSIVPLTHWQTNSWSFPASKLFLFSKLEAFISQSKDLRIKGFVKTDQGDYLLNAVSGVSNFETIEGLQKSVIEIIGEKFDEKVLDELLNICLAN